MIRFNGKPIKSAIFDMDGTMFDTERLRFQTLRQASQELSGHMLSDAVLIGSLGLSARKAEELALQHFGDDYPYVAIRKRADELELQHVRTHGVPIKPGLLQVLERLRKNGLTLAVATSSRRAIAEEYLINANVLKYFDITVCGDEVSRGKPHPEIFLRAAEALNSAPAECLMLEDSENGLSAAVDAGGLAILIEDIKPPRAEIRARAFAGYRDMNAFLADLMACTPDLGMPSLTDPFPQALNQIRAGIHGFGAIGGGYLAQVFCHWDGYTRPAEILATTGSQSTREAVNAFGRYSVRYGAHAFDQAIERIRLIDAADHDAVARMYRDCEIIGISLPESAIAGQADVIAQGLALRHAQSQASGGAAQPMRELTLLIVLNKIDAGPYVRRLVEAALQARVGAEVCAQILARTHFSETVVSRIVSKLSREALARQLRIKSQIFTSRLQQQHRTAAQADAADDDATPPSELEHLVSRLEQAAQPARILGGLHLILFNSEPDMPLYAARGSALLERLRQVQTVPDIGQIQSIKNRLWNGTHAMIAWHASLLGHDTIGRGMGDRRVEALVMRVIREEIEPALLREHPAMQDVVQRFVEAFIERCRASFKDPCVRVGRDPLRKLQRRERILGSIELARKHGIQTPALEYGAALALTYAVRSPQGAPDVECQRIQDLYRRGHSIDAVLTFHGNYNGQPYAGLDPQRDAALIARISGHFEKLAMPGSQHLDWPLATRTVPH